MSNFTTLVNALSNAIICISTIFFIIFVYRKNSMLYKLPSIEVLLVKIGLSFMASGSLFSLLTFSNPPISEVLLNLGLACVFAWASIFHYKYFVKKK